MDRISTSSAGLGCAAVLIFLVVAWLIIVGVVGFLWLCALLVKGHWDRVRSGGTSVRRSTDAQVMLGVFALAILIAVCFLTYSLINGDVFSMIEEMALEP